MHRTHVKGFPLTILATVSDPHFPAKAEKPSHKRVKIIVHPKTANQNLIRSTASPLATVLTTCARAHHELNRNPRIHHTTTSIRIGLIKGISCSIKSIFQSSVTLSQVYFLANSYPFTAISSR